MGEGGGGAQDCHLDFHTAIYMNSNFYLSNISISFSVLNRLILTTP